MYPRWIDLALGGLFVLFYAATRFNTPPTNRSSTTAGRYYLGLSLYGAAAVGAYLVLAHSPQLVWALLMEDPTAASGSRELPAKAQALSNPLLIAMLMTALPKLPLLGAADTWLRKRVQEIALIPVEVRRLSAELRRHEIVVPLQVQTAVRQQHLEDGFDPRDVRFERDETAIGRWTAVSTLLVQLADWDHDRRMVGYLGEYGNVLEQLRVRRATLRPKAKTCFGILRETAEQPATDKGREAAQQYTEDFAEQVAQLHRDLIDFISRGVLHAGLTDSARHLRLAALGFTVTEPPPAFTLNQSMFLAGLLTILLLFGFVFLRRGPPDILLVRAIVISAMYTVAVASVVVLKERWGWARRKPGELFPVAFYVVAGLMAVVLTQALGFALNVMVERGFAAGLQRYLLTFPWMLVTFTASLVTGFLVDAAPPKSWPRRRWRVLEGLIGAAALALASYFTRLWLMSLHERSLAEADGAVPATVPPLLSVLVTSCAVGFVIGSLVPHWYRTAPRRREQSVTPIPGSTSPGEPPRPAEVG